LACIDAVIFTHYLYALAIFGYRVSAQQKCVRHSIERIRVKCYDSGFIVAGFSSDKTIAAGAFLQVLEAQF